MNADDPSTSLRVCARGACTGGGGSRDTSSHGGGQEPAHCLRRQCEEGSTTIWFVGVIVALMVVVASFLGAANIFATRAHLQAVANLAALAAADSAPISAALEAEGAIAPSQSGCSVAEDVVGANGVKVTDCYHRDFDAYVVATASAKVLGLPVSVQAKARAGPAAEGIAELGAG